VRAVHTPQQVRDAEAARMTGMPEHALMQLAARGLATACLRRLPRVYGARVVLLVGSGGNGGDALYAGAHLASRGAAVEAVLLGTPLEHAVAAYTRAGGRLAAGAPDAPRSAELLVDGVLGIGGRGGLRPDAAAAVAAVRARRTVAVDVPSGVDAVTGEVAGEAVRADVTVTFGTLKPGLLVGAGRAHAGEVELVDIGLAPHLPPGDLEVLEPADVVRLLPVGDPVSDKYTRGVVGISAGSEQYTGAAVLAVTAAVRAGAGMVRFAGVDNAAQLVRAAQPEAVVTTVERGDGAAVVGAGRVQAWVLGPGLGTDAAGAAVVEAVLAQDVPVLVDADALTVCAAHPEWVQRRAAPTLLTPHDREYARFGRDVGPDRVAAARRLAADLGATVLLKGDATVVASAAGRVRVNPTGSSVLATAGTGDVLSGGAGTLLAAGLDALDAGSVAAWLHGRAGGLSAAGATTSALAVAQAWPDAVREAARLAG
jgi:ADP-dependent NAD(P)H-hydrate dehydratase / NAD(P)H-hydrate epimerase